MQLAENTAHKKNSQKFAICTPSHNFVSLYIFAIRCVSTIRKNLLQCLYNMGNFGALAVVIGSLVWGTPGNFNGFRVLAALLHGTLVVGVSQTLQRRTEGATYIRQGDHHVWHWPHSSLS